MRINRSTDPVVTPENFAQTVVEDYNLTPNYHAVITKAIQDQLSDFKAHSGMYDMEGGELLSSPILGAGAGGFRSIEATPKRGRLEGDEDKWWTEWRERVCAADKSKGKKGRGKKRRKLVKNEDDGAEGDVEDWAESESALWEKPIQVEDFTFNDAALPEEMRILIRVSLDLPSP